MTDFKACSHRLRKANTHRGINRNYLENGKEQTFVLILSNVSKGINSVHVNDLS